MRYVSVFDRHQVFSRLERFNATTWKEAAVRLTYSESQGSNPILRLRHAQILLFTPFFLRNICNGGWIWLLWKKNVAIRISFHLSLEVEEFNLYNLQTYCGSFTPLVKSIPDLGLKRGCSKGRRIGHNTILMSWCVMHGAIYILYPNPQTFFDRFVKGWCWFGAFHHFF